MSCVRGSTKSAMLARISTRNLSYEKARKRKAILRHTVDCSYGASSMVYPDVDIAVVYATVGLMVLFGTATCVAWLLDKLFR